MNAPDTTEGYWDWVNKPIGKGLFDGPKCPYCGAPEYDVVQILDGCYQSDRHVEFITTNCCDEMEEEFQGLVEAYGFAEVTQHTKVELILGKYLGGQRIFNDPLAFDEPWKADYGLSVETLGGFSNDELWNSGIFRQKDAQEFIREHHRHNGPPAGWKWAHAIRNGPEVIGVVWVGRPVARQIDHTTVVEVNRLCLNHDLDRHLTWKAASLGYNTAADTARARGFNRIITYTNADFESGISLQYARWKKDGPPSKGGSWNRPSRQRNTTSSTAPKQRWVKILRTPSTH